MISLPDREARLAALANSLPADLNAILADITDRAAETDIDDGEFAAMCRHFGDQL